MQRAHVVSVLLILLVAEGVDVNPLAGVLTLLHGLHDKIVAEDKIEIAQYTEYAEWCHDFSANTENEITAGTSRVNKLQAKIGELTSDVEVAGSKIEELVAAISSSQKELQDATDIRKKEAADYAVAEKELVDTTETLDRAITVLEREMQKNSAALLQLDTTTMDHLVLSLGAVIDAAGFPSADRQALVALVQSQQGSDSDDGDLGAPAAAAYKSHSSNIIEVLEDLKEKAETQLSELRKSETTTAQNYAMLKQSLEGQTAADTDDLAQQKSGKAAAEEGKAVATGDLEVTAKGVEGLKKSLEIAQSHCRQVSVDHQVTVKARSLELKVIMEGIEALESTTSGAEEQTYSMFQVAASSSSETYKGSKVLPILKRLAQNHPSASLAQLVSRVAATFRLGAGISDDVFGKVKEQLTGMITKLKQEATADATEKSYCDEEMAKTATKKEELEDDIAKMTTKVDQDAARSAGLKEDVKVLLAELASLAKTQIEMTKLREQENAAYKQAKTDLTKGLAGVRQALGILRDYYASKEEGAAMLQDSAKFNAFMQQPEPAAPQGHSKATGAATSIIGILEVVESDMATDLSKEETLEEDLQTSYEKITEENRITKRSKEEDVKYKTQEFKGLDKSITEISADRDTTNSEYSAVIEYFTKLKERCIAKPATYEARKKKRESEIAGLKSALESLDKEVAFLQRKRRDGKIRASFLAGAPQ